MKLQLTNFGLEEPLLAIQWLCGCKACQQHCSQRREIRELVLLFHTIHFSRWVPKHSSGFCFTQQNVKSIWCQARQCSSSGNREVFSCLPSYSSTVRPSGHKVFILLEIQCGLGLIFCFFKDA